MPIHGEVITQIANRPEAKIQIRSVAVGHG